MTHDPAALESEAFAAIADATDDDALDAVRVAYLGRKGKLTSILRTLGTLDPQERARVGQSANVLKRKINDALDERRHALSAARTDAAPAIDVTLPGRPLHVGGRHVLSALLDEMVEIFHGMGFSVALGPDVEDDYHNFEALNIPPGHPARDMHDTFFVDDTTVLRTHTSPVQIRVMESTPPPIRMIFPGRVYRNEALDATHAAEFNQVEILYVDHGVTFRDLKGSLETFVHELLGHDVKTRFRPSYFPFTEPSAELDIYWTAGKRPDWVEVLGCGMVHPRVFEYVGYDPERVSGYAAGIGLERIAMLRHGIPDIRYFTDNDVRFLSQF